MLKILWKKFIRLFSKQPESRPQNIEGPYRWAELTFTNHTVGSFGLAEEQVNDLILSAKPSLDQRLGMADDLLSHYGNELVDAISANLYKDKVIINNKKYK